jgi:maleylpyruvate isomerase
MDLYGYFRSSAAYRVRIALNLKGIDYQQIAVNLLHSAQREESYIARNKQGLVPTLGLDEGSFITQSTAIIEWLEETYPTPALLPESPLQRANIRALCNIVACEIHPLNNLRVLKYLQDELGVDEIQKTTWYQHWVAEGFNAIDAMLSEGPFAMGDSITMADLYLVPQVFNALRFKQDMSPYPKIMACYNACNQVEAFIAAAPANQPDAV